MLRKFWRILLRKTKLNVNILLIKKFMDKNDRNVIVTVINIWWITGLRVKEIKVILANLISFHQAMRHNLSDDVSQSFMKQLWHTTYVFEGNHHILSDFFKVKSAKCLKLANEIRARAWERERESFQLKSLLEQITVIPTSAKVQSPQSSSAQLIERPRRTLSVACNS